MLSNNASSSIHLRYFEVRNDMADVHNVLVYHLYQSILKRERERGGGERKRERKTKRERARERGEKRERVTVFSNNTVSSVLSTIKKKPFEIQNT